MKHTLVLLAGVAVLLGAAFALTRVVAAPAATTGQEAPTLLTLPQATPAGQTSLFGHLKSLVRKQGHWEMRFDPALLLKGTAAEHAALEDTGSSDVPNDSYTLEESHRLLTFVVAPNAHISVLSKGLGTITVPVSELAQIVKGNNPNHRPLFDRMNALGYWIRIGAKYPNPVLSMDQQYQP